jgi:hypothetical protein
MVNAPSLEAAKAAKVRAASALLAPTTTTKAKATKPKPKPFNVFFITYNFIRLKRTLLII